ncbi:MAG: glycosyltransferase family 9 protein [Succinivibrio sp.]|nr:glycosyltransferase family 9 protein [Succinivibrio sp.]
MFKVKTLNQTYALKTILKELYRLPARLLPAWWRGKSLGAKAAVSELEGVRSVLLLRNDRIGDLVVTTPLIRALDEAGFEVYVSSRAYALQALKGNPHVKGTLVYADHGRDFEHSLAELSKHEFDLAIDLQYQSGLAPRHAKYCAAVKCRYLLGFAKSALPCYNLNLPWYTEDAHITGMLQAAASELKLRLKGDYPSLEPLNLHYEVFADEASLQHAQKFVASLGKSDKPLALLNPYGSDPQGTRSRKCLTVEQARFIAQELQGRFKVVLTGEQRYLGVLAQDLKLPVYPSQTLTELFALTKMAALVVTVDTALAHVACCYDKPELVFHLEFPRLKDLYPERALFRIARRLENYEEHCAALINDGPSLRERGLYLPPLWRSAPAWRPLNPKAQQLVFEAQALEMVPQEEFARCSAAALAQVTESVGT